MAVTRESYIAQSPWTAIQLADLFRLAFIDAGYMTEWYDSFESGGIAHRILEITYNGSKVFGKTYYWFLFTNNLIYYSIATGWNSTTHLPIGTLDLDYRNSSTTTVTGHTLLATLNTVTTVTLTRWTSGVDSNFSYFLIKNGTTEIPLHISLVPPVSWIDLNKVCYHCIGYFRIGREAGGSWMRFTHYNNLIKRSWVAGGTGTNSSQMNNTLPRALNPDHGGATHGYFISSQFNNPGSGSAYIPAAGQGVHLPAPRAYTNPEYTVTQTPIYSNLLLSLYSSSIMPSDFGYTGYLDSSILQSFDQYIVSAGTEVWDVISVSNGSVGTELTTLILARTV